MTNRVSNICKKAQPHYAAVLLFPLMEIKKIVKINVWKRWIFKKKGIHVVSRKKYKEGNDRWKQNDLQKIRIIVYIVKESASQKV